MSREQPPVFVDHAAFVTPLVTVGEFRCTPTHPRFEDSGPIREDCFVFPRLAVAIQHEHERAFVANPNMVAFYNAGQIYRRLPISPDGDHCDWFGVDRQTVSDVLAEAGADTVAHSDGPFAWSRLLSDPLIYLAQRQIVEAVSGGQAEAADVEERVILLLDRLVRSMNGPAPRAPIRFGRGTRDAIHHVEVLISARWNEPFQLSELARAAGLSVFHLCRAFRALTGRTLHQYRHQLRLRAALDAVRRTPRSLVDIALDAGFCSHSHFTDAFHREFGVSPSMCRRGGGHIIRRRADPQFHAHS